MDLANAAPGAGPLEKLDVALGEELAETRHTWPSQLLGQLCKLGDQEPLYALGAALFGLGLVTRRPKLVEAGLRVGLANGAADLGKSALKKVVTRTRPNVLMDQGRYESELGGSEEKPAQSFPSGHMACSVAAARAVQRVYPSSAPWGYAACAALGWGRVAKAAHWPADVAAGAVVGLAAEALTARAFDAGKRAWSRRRQA